MNLSGLQREETHLLEQPLEDGAGFIKLLLTISALSGTDVSEVSTYTLTPLQRQGIVQQYVSNNINPMLHNVHCSVHPIFAPPPPHELSTTFIA